MRLLVLGGTQFVGYAIVQAALAAGWHVGVQVVRGDRAKTDDIRRLADGGAWDAVVDTSGYVP